MKFENRVAVITGGAGRIGRALTAEMCKNGVAVALTDYSLEAAEKTAAMFEGKGNVKAYEMNVSSTESVNAAAKQILADFGKVDIVVNNAGIWTPMLLFTELDEEYFNRIVDVSLHGTFRVTKAFLNNMLENGYGRIINLGSIAGEVGLPKGVPYSAAKAGVIMMTKTLAMELGRKHITVNCVSPGMITDDDQPMLGTKTTWVERAGTGKEVADVIMFLASDEASYITGVDYTVDGGRILGPRFSDI